MAANDRTEGGDPACWLARVCAECGRYVEEANAVMCPQCGSELPQQGD